MALYLSIKAYSNILNDGGECMCVSNAFAKRDDSHHAGKYYILSLASVDAIESYVYKKKISLRHRVSCAYQM